MQERFSQKEKQVLKAPAFLLGIFTTGGLWYKQIHDPMMKAATNAAIMEIDILGTTNWVAQITRAETMNPTIHGHGRHLSAEDRLNDPADPCDDQGRQQSVEKTYGPKARQDETVPSTRRH